MGNVRLLGLYSAPTRPLVGGDGGECRGGGGGSVGQGGM